MLSTVKFTTNKPAPEVNLDGWAGLPDLLLEQILSYLPLRSKYRCSLTCMNWYRVFLSEKCWDTFIYKDYIFTKRRFTLHSGYNYFVDHWRLRFLVSRMTRLWRYFVVKPVSLLSNFYEFIRVITNFTEYYENQQENPLENIRSFEFEWRLHIQHRADEVPQPYGTGGRLLQGVSMLLSHLWGLDMLALRQLLLEKNEADKFMDELLEYFSEKLTNLCILNLTKTRHSFFHLGLFLFLNKLSVSPQHLNEDVVILLGQNQNLRQIFLIQDENTKGASPVAGSAWRQLRKSAPKIRVHLRIRGRTTEDMVWQESAPVVSIVYDTPASKLSPQNALVIVDYYADVLETFVQRGLQRKYRGKKFEERADFSVVMLVRNCTRLRTLAIRERLSTATVLLVGHLCSFINEKFYFCVRRNAILKRNDWPYNDKEWSVEFYEWLKTSSRDYDLTAQELDKLLRGSGKLLSDNDYKTAFRHTFG